jgi:hypothetical protein
MYRRRFDPGASESKVMSAVFAATRLSIGT